MRIVRVQALMENLRGSFWIVPGAAVLAALGAGVLLPRVHVASDGPWASYVFTGSADGARAVLTAIATSIITVTSLTFSLTVVTLQLASSQFSPRLLRTFLRDLRNQAVLATLLATFLYSLTVLRIIRSGTGNSDDDVPKVAVSFSYLLVIASVLALVWYLHHIVSVIRVDTLIAGVRDETLRVAGRAAAARQSPHDPPGVDVAMPSLPRDSVPVLVRQSGFLLAIDTDAVEAWARAEDAVVAVDARPGTWLLRGTPCARVSFAGDARPEDAADALLGRIAVGNERTTQQDTEFGVRQLVDVAARALSPGINDPTTAVHCVDHLGDVLVSLADSTLGCDVRRGDDDALLVAVAGATFDDYLELACGQIRRYGAGEPAVVCALLSVLDGVGAQVTGPRRQSVRTQVDALVADAHRSIRSPHDAAVVRERAERVAQSLT